MKKVKLKKDIKIIGWRTLKAEEIFFVDKYNKRFIYIKENNFQIRLNYNECEKVS